MSRFLVPRFLVRGIRVVSEKRALTSIADFMNDHPNKHIRAAIDYALGRGWRLVKSGSRAHAWGRLFCSAQVRGGCIVSIYGTPRVPEHHAAYLRRVVDACPH